MGGRYRVRPTMLLAEVRALVRLAVPVVTVQLGMMARGFVDTVLLGHLSEHALGAGALGNAYVFFFLCFGMGVVMAADPVVAQAVGAQDHAATARGVQRSLMLAGLFTLPSVVVLLFADTLLSWVRLGQHDALGADAAGYARISAWGALPFFAFVALRQSLQAMHRMAPIVWAIVLGNLLNVLLDWMFIFGRLGAPAMGVAGSAWATVLCRWLMPAILLVLAWPQLRPVLRPWHPDVLLARPLWLLVRLGVPIGTQFCLEMGAFYGALLIMDHLGQTELGAHQVTVNLASLSFMVPLGISQAAAVRVGNAIGRAEPAAARRSAWVALGAGAATMSGFGVLFLTAPGWLATLYTNQAAVLTLAATLIPIAGVFQVFDGLQVVSIGILRGTGETHTPMLINILGFWLLGVPTSLWLGLGMGGGAPGVWWGLVIGLVTVAVALVARVRIRLRQGLQRLV